MPITRTAMVDDDGSGTTGTIFNNAWKTELYNQIDAADAPAWQTIAGSFTITDAGGVTLAASVAVNRYVVMGHVAVWEFRANPITVTTATLQIWFNNLPFNCANLSQVNSVALCQVPMYLDAYSANRLRLGRTDFANFAVGSTYAGFTSVWEI